VSKTKLSLIKNTLCSKDGRRYKILVPTSISSFYLRRKEKYLEENGSEKDIEEVSGNRKRGK
jgi:hypothetical protein